MVWALGLVAVVLPAFLLLLLVRAVAERVEPGYGTAAAVALGAGTLILPFSTLFFSHVLSATLAFAAFAVFWRERAGPERLLLVAAGGALAGFAIVTEYPLGLAAVVLGVYAMRRSLRRGAAYAAGLAAGVAPLVIYNVWAFGSPTHSSYKGAVAIQGDTGHDVVGLNDGGFFGIDLPDPQIAIDLLVANKGLLTLAPVLGLALVGVVLLHRRGLRAEAYVIGGDVPVVPHLQLGLLAAVRRRLARAAVPHPGAAVPGRSAGTRLAALARHFARARRGVHRPDGDRDRDAASDRKRRHRLLGAHRRDRDVRAHDRERCRASTTAGSRCRRSFSPWWARPCSRRARRARSSGAAGSASPQSASSCCGPCWPWRCPSTAAATWGSKATPSIPLIAAAAAAGLVALAVSTPLSRLARASGDRSPRQSRTPPVPSSGRSRP